MLLPDLPGGWGEDRQQAQTESRAEHPQTENLDNHGHPLCILSIKRLCARANLGHCTLTLGQAGLALWGKPGSQAWPAHPLGQPLLPRPRAHRGAGAGRAGKGLPYCSAPGTDAHPEK